MEKNDELETHHYSQCTQHKIKSNNSPINQLIKEGNSPGWAKNNNNSPQQPPWANKGAVQTKPVETSNQPPWAKNSQNTSQTNNQPPWAKNNTTNAPAWAKNSQNETNATNNQPAWMKNNQNSAQNSNSPAWMKDKESNNSSPTVPPWMKGSNNSSQSNSNMWKSKQAAEVQKQKKQFEEKMKREEEQERESKRLEKQKKEKEQEQANIARELGAMAKEEEYSLARQRFQKEEAERIQRERIQQQLRVKEQQQRRLRQQQEERQRKQEQERLKIVQQEEERKRREEQQERKRLEQNQRLENERLERQRLVHSEKVIQKTKAESRKKATRKKKIQNLQTSKISHISSIKGFQQIGRSENQRSVPENFYHKYLRLINEQSQENDYKVKIQLQKNIYQVQLEFKKECESELINLFTSRKVNNRKRKLIFSNSMQIQYALCEGKKEDDKLEFITEEIQELRNRFMQYQLLTKCVLNLMRKKINLRLRVPLLNLAQYKGVTFLIQYVCHQLVDIIEIQIGLFQQIANEVLIFQKELELQQDGRFDLRPISKDQLMAKKISVYGEDYYILYLKNEQKTAVKSKKPENSSKFLSQSMHKICQMNDLTFLEFVIGQNNILPYYQPPLPSYKALHQQISKIGSPTVKRIASCINISNAINIVYSSCQGQVNEQSFFQLAIQNNKELANMISNAGGSISKAPQPLALCYLQKLAAVTFNFTNGMYKQKGKELIKRIKPVVFIQKHEFELLQFVKNMEKYITEDKQELVEQCLSLGRRLWQDIDSNQPSDTFNFIMFKNEISYLLFKQQQKQAIQLIQTTRQKMGKLFIQRIPLDLLALKIYVTKNMQMPMLKLLSQLLETLQFYFGEESIIHAFVYTIIGSYYSKETEQADEDNRSQKVITFYEHALNIALKQNGQKALEVADIYLSRAQAFLNLNQFGQFEKDIQNALKIYKMHSKSAPKIAHCNLIQGRAKCAEGKVTQGLQLMEVSSNQFMKMYNYIESLCILFETLPFLQNKQSELQIKIQKIVEICFTYKSVWAFRRISTLVIDKELNCYTSLTLHNLQELFHPLEPDDRTNEQVMIDLEDEIKGFTSFIEIVRWGLSIIAAKLTSRRQATNQYQKAHSIIGQIFHFYSKSQTMSLELKDSQII